MKTIFTIIFSLCLTVLTGCQSWMGSVTPKKQPVALVAIPPQPPLPPGAESYRVTAQPAVMATAAVVLPIDGPLLPFTWNINGVPPLLISDRVFEFWRTSTMAQAFSLFAVTNQPPIHLPTGFYICRTKNTTTEEVSGWNIKR